ncbi:putative invasion protein [Mycobacterium intracellulare]|nr:putative invasion protein [Mycobacterium intracellulare]
MRTEREVMRRKRFRLINFAWITTVVTGLMLSVAGPAPVAAADPGAWDPTLPAQISAGAPGDPLAVANASLQATAQATQTTFNLGKQFLGGLGINIGGDPAPSAATPSNPAARSRGSTGGRPSST